MKRTQRRFLLIVCLAASVWEYPGILVQAAEAQTYRGTLDDHDEPGSPPSMRKKVTVRYVKSGGRQLASVNNSPYFPVPVGSNEYGTSPFFKGERGCMQQFTLSSPKPGRSKFIVFLGSELHCGSKIYGYWVWGWIRR